MIDQIVRAALIGAAAAFLLVYGFNSKKAYPKWMLAHYEHPWLWIVLAGVAVFLFVYDMVLFVLFVLMLVSIHLDMMVFGKKNTSDDDGSSVSDGDQADLFDDDRITYGVPLSKTGEAAYYGL